MKQIKLKILVCVILGMTGSSHAASPGATPRKQQTRAAYRAELDALMNENKVACKVAQDCEAHALGVKPCGGPTEYLIMSKGTRTKISDALTDLTKTINEMDTVSNEGTVGTCVALQKPEVDCHAGTCAKKAAKN